MPYALISAETRTTPWLNIAWKFIWTAKDSWLGPTAGPGLNSGAYTTSLWIHLRDTT